MCLIFFLNLRLIYIYIYISTNRLSMWHDPCNWVYRGYQRLGGASLGFGYGYGNHKLHSPLVMAIEHFVSGTARKSASDHLVTGIVKPSKVGR